MASLLVVLGDQLFEKTADHSSPVFMAESRALCTHFRYHKKKLIFFLAAMRSYRDQLVAQGRKVHYHSLSPQLDFFDHLQACVKKLQIDELVLYTVDDRFFEIDIVDFAKKMKLRLRFVESRKFVTSTADLDAYFLKAKKPFMKTFYERQRKAMKILVDANNKPEGGAWSYDTENRLPLKKDTPLPLREYSPTSPHLSDVAKMVAKEFSAHPGQLENFAYPTTRQESLAAMKIFMSECLDLFGPYEDALTQRSDFVFHSVLSPLMNSGLLEPREVIDAALTRYQQKKARLASVEGFIRQIIGWREFIRGIDRTYHAREHSENYWNHQRFLTIDWYQGTTGIDPLDATIKKVDRLAYAHHIERLMILSNLMLLSEIHPQQVYKWFMEMFIDSADWVMGPNVFGMGQFSDGGIFATKPYTCGSNYILKMSDYPKGEWCETVDGLYWAFIDKHKKFYSKNPRMKVMVASLDKMDSTRRKKIMKAAAIFKEKRTQAKPL
jgi:deoxyribodipyrimidine photolyase-related protein